MKLRKVLGVAGLLLLAIGGAWADGETAKQKAMRALAPFAPGEFQVQFSTDDLYRTRYLELKKVSPDSLEPLKLLELCSLCEALALDNEVASTARVAIAKLEAKAKASPLNNEDKILLAEFYAYAKQGEAAVDLLLPIKAAQAGNMRYWLILGKAFACESKPELPKNDLKSADPFYLLAFPFQASPEYRKKWIENSPSLQECSTKAKWLAKTKPEIAEVAEECLFWSMPKEALEALPDQGPFWDFYVDACAKTAKAGIDAFADRPVGAKSASRILRWLLVWKIAASFQRFPDSLRELTGEDVIKSIDAEIAKGERSSDPKLKSFFLYLDCFFLQSKGKVAESLHMADKNTDLTADNPMLIYLLLPISFGKPGEAPGLDVAERTRLAEKGVRLGEEWLKTREDRQLRNCLVASYRLMGNLDKAKPHIDAMLKADPQDPSVNLTLAGWYLRQPGPAVNMVEIGKCLDLANPGLAKGSAEFKAAYNTDLAIFLELRGDHERARSSLEYAIRTAPGYEPARLVWAELTK
jgi:tetratricopeptide (TPR) repeat protein